MKQIKEKMHSRPQKTIKVLKFKKELGFKTTKERSALMKRIKSKNTKPEIIIRKALSVAGIRYRLNVKGLSGRPDIVIAKPKIVIFIDGEFWHGYNWKEKRKRIKTNRKFWIPKIERNIQRDMENNYALKSAGYKVLRFWEKEIKKELHTCIQRVIYEMRA